MKQPKVSIVLLNWNRVKDTIDCLKSLYRIDYSNFEIILVDNASGDDSVNQIIKFAKSAKVHITNCRNTSPELAKKKRQFDQIVSSKLFLIENDQNYGFAKGNNVAMKLILEQKKSGYILLLNSDTTVEKEFLSKLVSSIEADQQIGSIQAAILTPTKKTVDSLGQEIKDGKIYDVGHGKKLGLENGITEIFGCCAACALYRCGVLAQTGIFDEAYQTVLEDVDLSFKIRLAGYKNVLCTTAVIYHKGGLSRVKKNRFNNFQTYLGSRNTLMIYCRYLKIKRNYVLPFIYHLMIATLLSLRFLKFIDLVSKLFHSARIKKNNKANPNFKKIQTKWQK